MNIKNKIAPETENPREFKYILIFFAPRAANETCN